MERKNIAAAPRMCYNSSEIFEEGMEHAVFQIVLYCLLYLLLVKCAVRDSGRNCLYFYPKEYIAEAQRRGIAGRDEVIHLE